MTNIANAKKEKKISDEYLGRYFFYIYSPERFIRKKRKNERIYYFDFFKMMITQLMDKISRDYERYELLPFPIDN